MVVRLRTVTPAAGIRAAMVGGVASWLEESDKSITKSLLLPSEALNDCTTRTFVPETRKALGFATASVCGGTGWVSSGNGESLNGISAMGMLKGAAAR